MTPKALLISLAISCVLAVVAILLMLPELREQPADTRPVLDLGVGDVVELGLTDENGREWSLAREGGEWILAWPVGNGQKRRWPAEAGNVRGAIRLLIENLERDSEGLELVEPEATLSLRALAGDWRIEFGPSRVGGQTPVRVTPPDGDAIAARIGTQVRDVFSGDGLMAWRSTTAIPFLDRGVDRIYLQAGRRESQSGQPEPIRLARLNGRWSLVEPIAARADDARCRELLSTLQRWKIVAFHDDLEVTSPAIGLDEPGAIIALERDVPGKPGERVLTGVAIGTTAGLENKHVYVALELREVPREGEARVLLGPVVVTVAVEDVNGVVPFPRAYLSGRTLEAGVPDVRRLEVTRRSDSPQTFLRSVTGWTDGQGAVTSASAVEALDDLLSVLTTERAPQIELERPEGLEELAVAEPRDASGKSLGRVGLAVVEREGRPVALATQVGGVIRLYPVEAHVRLLSWLRRGP